MTIKSYSDDISKLKADVLHIIVDTTTNVNNIVDLNLLIKTGLSDVSAKFDQHEMNQDRELDFRAKNNK